MSDTREAIRKAHDAYDVYGLNLVNTLGSSIPTMLMPDRQLPGVAGYVPGTGLVEGIAGTVGTLLDAGSTVANAGLEGLGYQTRLPSAPQVLTSAGEHYETTRGGVQDVIAANSPFTKPDPNDPVARAIDIFGSSVGSVLPFVPVGVAKAATSLVPYGTKTLTNFLLPSTASLGKNIPLAAGLGTASAGLDAVTNPVEAAPTTQPDAIPIVQGIQQQIAQPTSVAAPSSGSIIQDMVNEQRPSAPTFGETGYSPMTLGQAFGTLAIAAVALAAGKRIHGTSRVVNDMSRDMRFNDPEYAAKAADFNNDRIMRGGSEISAKTPGEGAPDVPLPEQNKLRQTTNWLNNTFLNENAGMMDAIKMTAEPTTAQKIAHQYGLMHNDISWSGRVANFVETGRDPDSGVKVPRLTRLYRDFATLKNEDQPRYKILNDALYARDELFGNRADNLKQFAKNNPGVTPRPEDIRHNFKHQSNEELQTIIDRATSDPQLNDLMERYHAVPKGMVDIGEAHGFFTPSEKRDLLATHPYHVPEVGPTGETKHPMQRRDKTLSTGVEQVNAEAIVSLAQHVEKLYRQIHLNDMNRGIRKSYMDVQATYPDAAQFMYDVPAPSHSTPTFYASGTFNDPVVTVRHATGPTFTKVEHPDYYSAMKHDSLSKKEIGVGILTIPRRMYTYMTTGVGSLVTGGVAPLTNAAYTSLSMGVNAPKRTYGGLLDRTVQRNLPTGVANVLSPIARGIDTATTTPVGIGYSYLRGAGDRWMWRGAKIIEKGQDNEINNYLRARYGDAYIDTWQDAIQRAFEASKTAQFAERGIGGMGIPVRTDLPTLQMKSDVDAKLVTARLVPELFTNNGAFGNVAPRVVNMNRMVQEAMSHVSDAGHEYYARLNWDNPNLSPEQLTYETRNLTGDPGVRGASTTVRNILSVLPFGNIGIQGSARLGRSLGERSFGAPMTLMTGVGSIVLGAEIFSHMRSREHMDYYENELSPEQRASRIVIATSDDPRSPTMIKVPQEMQAAKAFLSEVFSKAVNITAMQHDPDWYKNVWNGIVDFMGSHVSNASVDATIHGGIAAVDVINLPPYAGHIDLYGLTQDKSIVDSYRGIGGTKPLDLPNQVQDGPLDGVEGRVFSGIVKAVLGLGGVALEGANNVARYAKQTGSWADALGMGGHDWLQGMKDRNPMFNTVWEHQLRSSMQPAIEEQVSRKIAAINNVSGGRTDLIAEGTTGRNRYAQPVPPTTTTKLPTDPTMMALFNIVQAYKTRMTGREQEITELKQQKASVEMQGMDVDERRKWSNDQTRIIGDKYRVLGAMVADMEYALSLQVGRAVHIEDVDFKRGPEQFAD